MKRNKIITLCAVVLLLSGCTQADNTAIDSSESYVHESNEAVVENSEAGDANSIDTIESVEDMQSTMDITDSELQNESETTSEINQDSMDEILEWYRESSNETPLNLTPEEVEYASYDENGGVVWNPDGDLYGFEADLTQGCSVWCAVNEYAAAAEASSTLDPQGDNHYDAVNLLSGSRGDAWVEGSEGNGIDETITLKKRYSVAGDYGDRNCIFFTNICVVNGFAKSEKAWRENGRVKTLKMYYNEEYICDLELLDTAKPQVISLSGLYLEAQNHAESSFRFEIADVYPGEKYEDTAITGIEIKFNTPNH